MAHAPTIARRFPPKLFDTRSGSYVRLSGQQAERNRACKKFKAHHRCLQIGQTLLAGGSEEKSFRRVSVGASTVVVLFGAYFVPA